MNDVIERAKKYLDCVEALENAVGAYAGSNAMVAMNKLNASPEGLISELLTLVPEDKDEWQDISTAPENCEPVLLTNSNYLDYMFVGYFDPNIREWRYWGTEDDKYEGESLTHWQPLPTLPKQEQSKPKKE